MPVVYKRTHVREAAAALLTPFRHDLTVGAGVKASATLYVDPEYADIDLVPLPITASYFPHIFTFESMTEDRKILDIVGDNEMIAGEGITLGFDGVHHYVDTAPFEVSDSILTIPSGSFGEFTSDTEPNSLAMLLKTSGSVENGHIFSWKSGTPFSSDVRVHIAIVGSNVEVNGSSVPGWRSGEWNVLFLNFWYAHAILAALNDGESIAASVIPSLRDGLQPMWLRAHSGPPVVQGYRGQLGAIAMFKDLIGEPNNAWYTDRPAIASRLLNAQSLLE